MVGVTLDDKRVVTLSMTPEDVVEMLGKPETTVTLIKDTKLQRLNYDSLGFSLLTYDQLLAIMLHDEKAPRLQIHGSGLASNTARDGFDRHVERRIRKAIRCRSSLRHDRRFHGPLSLLSGPRPGRAVQGRESRGSGDRTALAGKSGK